MSKIIILLSFSFSLMMRSYSQNQAGDTSRIIQTNSEAFKLYGVDANKMREIGEDMLLASQEIQFEGGVAGSYNTIALACMSVGEYERAVENFLLALEIYEKNKSKSFISSVQNNMGVVYYYLGNHEQSLNYHLRALSIRELEGDSISIAKSLNNIGIAYKGLGQLDNALAYYKKALTIKQNLGDSIGSSNTFNNIGNVYLEQNKLKDAEVYFIKSLVLDSLSKKGAGMATSYLNLGTVSSKLNKLEMAKQQLKKSIDLSNQFETRQTKMLAYEQMSKLFEGEGKFEESLLWLQKWIQLKDSLDFAANSRTIAELESKYRNEKISVENAFLREQEKLKDEQIEKQNILLGIGSIAIVLFIMFTFYFMRSYRLKRTNLELEKNKNEEITAKNELILEQKEELEKINEAKNKMFAIMSHDIRAPFNNLISTMEMASKDILSKEQTSDLIKKIATEATNVSDFISNMLEWIKTQMTGIQITKENLFLAPIVELVLNQNRTIAKLKDVVLTNSIDKSVQSYGDQNLVKAILRNLVSNAIKYTEKGSISVYAIAGDGNIHISVVDTGVGISEKDIDRIFSNDYFSTIGTADEIGTGMGLMLIKEFVLKNGGLLKIKSEEGMGSTFTFSMPSAE